MCRAIRKAPNHQGPQILSKVISLVIVYTLSWTVLAAQEHKSDTTSGSKSGSNKSVRNLAIASTVVYGVSLYGLNQTWYQDSPRTSFHFFNDNEEWKQLDKVGHFYSAFHISQASIHLFRHAGMTAKKSNLWGGMMGFLILAPIEILDGFSAEYGASWGDLIANAVGSGTAMAQYMIWNEARIKPKFSFAPTDFASKRPNVLGNGYHEQLIKDYNGQTYWLSFDIYSFMPSQTKFPKWINLALGYGVNNMVYASDRQNQLAGYHGYRQYYLAVDFDLSYLAGKNKFLNTLLYMVDLIHLPAPALEFNREDGVKFHFLKF
ncbi:MAG: DUF2279 domain-containing protein [Cyclobacteriaceae bacterium]|nr:MAG: DUF2279 domain-containing protein [Cyclobacteriaceae bacterium]